MKKHNLITSLFICCLSEDLIQYYNPLRFLADNYPKAKPEFLISQMQSFRDKQSNEWKRVKWIYYKIFKLRNYVIKLAYAFRTRKAIRNIRNTEDPVTLEAPKKPVQVIDIANN